MNIAAMKALAGLALVLGIIFAYQYWHHEVYQQGVTDRDAYWKNQNDIADKKAAAALAARNAVIAKAQLELNVARGTLDKLIQEKKDEEDKFNIERAVYASGAKRMSVVTASCKSGAAGKTESPAAASQLDATERTDLLPETATAILDIARHGAEDVQDFNSLAAQYQALSSACSQ